MLFYDNPYLFYFQNSRSYVCSTDLDPVENRYLVTGRNTGGLAINDASLSKNGKYKLVGNVKGGVKGSHRNEVNY